MQFYYVRGLDPVVIRVFEGDGVTSPENVTTVVRVKDQRDRVSLNNPTVTQIKEVVTDLSGGLIKVGSLEGVARQISQHS